MELPKIGSSFSGPKPNNSTKETRNPPIVSSAVPDAAEETVHDRLPSLEREMMMPPVTQSRRQLKEGEVKSPTGKRTGAPLVPSGGGGEGEGGGGVGGGGKVEVAVIEENKSLRKRVYEMEAAIADINTQLEEARGAQQATLLRAREAEGEAAVARAELARVEELADGSQALAQGHKNAVNELEFALKEAREERGKRGGADADSAALRTRVADLEKELAAKAAEVLAAQYNEGVHKAARKKSESKLSNAEGSLKMLRDESTSLETTVTRLEREKEAARKALEQAEADNQQLRMSFREGSATEKEGLARMMERDETHKTEMKKLKKDLTDAQARVERLSTDVERREDLLRRLSEELARETDARRDAEGTAGNLGAEGQRITRELAMREEECKRLEKEKETLVWGMARYLAKNKEEVDEWKSRWEQLTVDVAVKTSALEEELKGGGGKTIDKARRREEEAVRRMREDDKERGGVLLGRLGELRRGWGDTKKALVEEHARAEKLEKELGDAKYELARKLKECDNLKVRLEEEMSKFEGMGERMDRHGRELERDLDARRKAQDEELERVLKEAQDRLDKGERSKEEMQKELDECQRVLRECRDALEGEREKAKSRIKILLDELQVERQGRWKAEGKASQDELALHNAKEEWSRVLIGAEGEMRSVVQELKSEIQGVVQRSLVQDKDKDGLLDWGKQHEQRANEAEARLKLAEDAIEKLEGRQQSWKDFAAREQKIGNAIAQLHAAVGPMETALTCLVCLRPLNTSVTLSPCGHTVCSGCVFQEGSPPASCPECNTDCLAPGVKNLLADQLATKIVFQRQALEALQSAASM